MNSQINPQLFSLSAVLVGYVLTGDYSAAELNAIGNWLMLVGQYLETYSAQQSVIQNNNQQKQNSNNNHNLIIIEKALEKMRQEINEIKNRGEL